MAVGPDDQIAGAHEPLFGQEGVLHAAVAALIVVNNALFFGKLAADQHLIGGIYIFLRGKVIHDKGNLVAIKNLFRAHAAKRLDGKRAGNVIGKHHGHAALNNLSVLLHSFVRMSLQNFLRKRLSHVELLYILKRFHRYMFIRAISLWNCSADAKAAAATTWRGFWRKPRFRQNVALKQGVFQKQNAPSRHEKALAFALSALR